MTHSGRTPSTSAAARPLPRAARGRPQLRDATRWLFMRLSGVLLVVLVLGHLFVEPRSTARASTRSTSRFVAGKWASPFWQVWDLAMLWLAMLHGANGVRTIINDYAEQPGPGCWLQGRCCTSPPCSSSSSARW